MTKLPNFLVVGAAKSGTTSLYEYLRTHRQVFMPAFKEPSYFEPASGGIKIWERYCSLFEEADGYKRVGEASVSYLMSSTAAESIRGKLGRDIDIVILLRNPIDMAYSNWGHQVREGYERLDFLSALQDEDRRLSDVAFGQSAGRWLYDLTYAHRASYGSQIERYVRQFGKDRVHIYLFEEFFRSGLPLYGDLLKALDLDADHRPTEVAHNKAGKARSALLRRFLFERMAWKEPIKKIIPAKSRAKIMGALARFNRVDQELAPMSPEARRYLSSKLTADVKLQSDILGRDLASFWGIHG